MKEISGFRNLRKVKRKGSIKACFCPLETHLRITIHVPLWPLIAKEHLWKWIDLSPSKWLAENLPEILKKNRRLFIFYFEGGTYFSYHWSFPGLLKFLALLCWGISWCCYGFRYIYKCCYDLLRLDFTCEAGMRTRLASYITLAGFWSFVKLK